MIIRGQHKCIVVSQGFNQQFFLLLQRCGSVSTFCDKPKRIRAVCSVWRYWRAWHGLWSHRILQDKPHSAIWGVSDIFMFWGETKLISHFLLVALFKNEGLTGVLFLQALNEELYDIIQVSPKEKPVAAVRALSNMQRQQINSAAEQPPTRPPKSNRTLEASTVHKLHGDHSN